MTNIFGQSLVPSLYRGSVTLLFDCLTATKSLFLQTRSEYQVSKKTLEVSAYCCIL